MLYMLSVGTCVPSKFFPYKGWRRVRSVLISFNMLNQNMAVLTYAERADAKDSITRYTQDIDNQNVTLDNLKKSIANKKKSLGQLREKLQSVNDGSYKFVTPKSTGVLKQKEK